MKFARSKRRAITLAIIILALFSLYSLHEIILTRIGAYPVQQSVVAPSDLIVVVSGTLPEVHYGIDLYKAGYAPKLLFVGHFPVELAVLSKEPFELVEKPWDVIAGHMATSSGVPESRAPLCRCLYRQHLRTCGQLYRCGPPTRYPFDDRGQRLDSFPAHRRKRRQNYRQRAVGGVECTNASALRTRSLPL